MPQTLSRPQDVLPDQEIAFPRKKWTRQECVFLRETGQFASSRYELIEGDIVPKMGQNEPHAYVTMRLLEIIVGIFGFAFVRSQLPLYLDEFNEPEPDLAVTVHPLRDYLARGTPTASDIRLVIEVSDSTLAADTTIKARLYGRAGIPEYWILDIAGRRLLVFRQPHSEGYADRVAYSENEILFPLAAPDSAVRVADLLP